jgi:hypothetical protein
MKRGLGVLLLGVWLVLHGLSALVGFGFTGLGVLMAVLALVSGILILVGR